MKNKIKLNLRVIFGLLLMIILISGCSQIETPELDTFNLSDLNKDITLKGQIGLYKENNNNLYIFDNTNKQFRLTKCSKYNLKIGDITEIQGFAYEDNNNALIFECSTYSDSLNNSKIEYNDLLLKIDNKTKEIDKLDIKFKEINSSVNSKRTEYNGIIYDINNIAEERILDDIRDEIITRGEGLPPDPLVDQFKTYIVRNAKPEKIELLENNLEKEYYHFLYLDNKDYKYYIIGTKKIGSERYENYTIEPYRFR